MGIVDRVDWDIKDSVFVTINCPFCYEINSVLTSHYYGKIGYLGNEEGNKSGLRNGFNELDGSIN